MERKLLKTLIFTLLLLSGACVSAALPQDKPATPTKMANTETEYWALLIGCNYFPSPEPFWTNFKVIPGADTAVHELENVLLSSGVWLKDHIKVLTGANATTLKIHSAFRWLDQKEDADDICLVFMTTRTDGTKKDIFPKGDEKYGVEGMMHTASSYKLNKGWKIPYFSWIIDDQVGKWIQRLDGKVFFLLNGEKGSGNFINESSGSGKVVVSSCEEWRSYTNNAHHDSLFTSFAYMIIESLQGFADGNRDGFVSAEEVFAYAAPRIETFETREFFDTTIPEISNNVTDDLIIKPVQFPPSYPNVTGPTQGQSAKDYSYSIISIDPEGKKIKYSIDWDDGTTSETDFYPSGETVQVSHAWSTEGTYNVRVTNEDEGGLKLLTLAPAPTLVVSISDAGSIDQCQTATYNGQCFNDITLINSNASVVWFAQSFQPTVSTLTRIDIRSWVSLIGSFCLPSPDSSIHLSIRSSLYGPNIAEVNVSPYKISNRFENIFPKVRWTVADIPDIAVAPGETYYIVVQLTELGSYGGWSYLGLYSESDPYFTGTPYINGEPYYSEDQGNTWIHLPIIQDFCFITYGT